MSFDLLRTDVQTDLGLRCPYASKTDLLVNYEIGFLMKTIGDVKLPRGVTWRYYVVPKFCVTVFVTPRINSSSVDRVKSCV